LDLLLLACLDKPSLADPVERAEQRAGAEPYLAVRELRGALDDRVAVERAVQPRRQHELRRAAEFHVPDDMASDYMSSNDMSSRATSSESTARRAARQRDATSARSGRRASRAAPRSS